MTSTSILIILVCVLAFIILFLLTKLYKFSLIIIGIEDAIEDSLDILDERYKSMSEILEKPVFFDSVEVRQVIDDIKASHNAILRVANKLTNDIGIESEPKIEEKNKKD